MNKAPPTTSPTELFRVWLATLGPKQTASCQQIFEAGMMAAAPTPPAIGAVTGEEIIAALTPFAKYEMTAPHQEPDHWPAYGERAGQGCPTVGDFRRARALLARLKDGGGE